jgi:hypothetical protein
MGWVDWLLRPFRGPPPEAEGVTPAPEGGAPAPDAAPAPSGARPSTGEPHEAKSGPAEGPREPKKRKKKKARKYGLQAPPGPAPEARAAPAPAPRVEPRPEPEPQPPAPASEDARPAPARDPAEEARRAEAAENRRRARLPEFEALLSRTDALLAVAEVELRHLVSARRQLADGWSRLGKPPREALEALTAARDGRLADLDERIGAARAAADAERHAALAQRWAIVVEARALAEREQLKGAGPAMGELRARLRAVGRVERDDPTAAAFAAAEARLKERQEQLRSERDAARAEQLERLEQLVRRAEALAASADPVAAAERVKGLQATWKGVRVPGPRAEVDAAWARFRAACDAVFAARTAARAEADRVALERLEAVVVRMEALAEEGTDGDPDDDIAKALVAWKRAGRAPRAEQQALWERLQRAFDQLRAPPVDLGAQDEASLQFRPFEGLTRGDGSGPAGAEE